MLSEARIGYYIYFNSDVATTTTMYIITTIDITTTTTITTNITTNITATTTTTTTTTTWSLSSQCLPSPLRSCLTATNSLTQPRSVPK